MARLRSPRVSILFALVATVWLTGCSQPLHHFAFPPGRTQQDFERDARVCNLDSQTLQWNTWFGGRTMGQIDRRFRGLHDEARLQGDAAADEAVRAGSRPDSNDEERTLAVTLKTARCRSASHLGRGGSLH